MANRGLGYALMGLSGLAQGYMGQEEKNRLAEQNALDRSLKAKALDLQAKKDQADVDKLTGEFIGQGLMKDASGNIVANPDYYTEGSPLYNVEKQKSAFKAMGSPKAAGARPLTAGEIQSLRQKFASGAPLTPEEQAIAIPTGYSNIFPSGKTGAGSLTAGQIEALRNGGGDPNLVVPPAYAGTIYQKPQPGMDPVQIQKIIADTELARARADAERNKKPPLSKGQEAIDRKFGQEYADYYAGGGRTTVDKNLKGLEHAASQLRSGNAVTGPVVGLLPKWGRDILMPQTSAAEDEARQAIQSSLRPILGAQFTEQEGERILGQVWNPRLPPAQNAAKLDAALGQLRSMAADKESAARYFEQNGTLEGYVPTRAGNPSDARAASAKKLNISPKQLKQIDQVPVKRQYSPSRNKTRLTYADGRVEEVDGKQN